MQAYNWEELPGHEKGGRRQRVVAGERITVLRQRIFAGKSMYRPHAHPQEQMSIVLEGTAKFFCGGEEVVLGPGGIVVFPPGREHATENVGEGDLVLEEIFSPGVEVLNQLAPRG